MAQRPCDRLLWPGSDVANPHSLYREHRGDTRLPNFSPQFLQKSPGGNRSQTQTLESRWVVARRIFLNRCQSGRICLTFSRQANLLVGDNTVADSAPAVAFVAQQQLSRNRPVSSRVRKCGWTAAVAISEVGRCPSDSLPRDPLASSEPIQVSTRFLTVAPTVHTWPGSSE